MGVSHSVKSKDAFIQDLIVNEYIGTGEDRVRNRDGFTEVIGDLFFTIPAIKAANAHRGNFFFFLAQDYANQIATFLYLLLQSF